MRVLSLATLKLVEPDMKKVGGFVKPWMGWTHEATGNTAKITQCRVAHVPEKGANDVGSDGGGGGVRLQVHVNPLLSQLSKIREAGGTAVDSCYAVMGITMIDLFSSPEDLFVAGMAAGASNVAVFSFHRYHPCLKMDPECWSDYSYVGRASEYSYYEDGKKRPAARLFPPTTKAVESKNLFRAGKSGSGCYQARDFAVAHSHKPMLVSIHSEVVGPRDDAPLRHRPLHLSRVYNERLGVGYGRAITSNLMVGNYLPLQTCSYWI